MRSAETPPSRRLDCRGLLCPLPALETRGALAELGEGEVLEVLCTDPLARIDLRALCDETGDEILSLSESGGVLRFRIRRLARSDDA